MVPKPLFLVGRLQLSFLKVLEWDYWGGWWKNLWRTMREPWVRSLGGEGPLEKGGAPHSSVLAWRTLWTVQSMGLQSWTRRGVLVC